MLTPTLSPLPVDWALRCALPADAETLARLCAAHAAYERIPHCVDGYVDRLARGLQTQRLSAWLGLLGGHAVGYASATLDYATLSARPFLHLDCLYLDPGARGLGLGRELLGAVLRRASALGCEQVQWQTPAWNDDAIRFYDRLGAKRLSKQRYSLACAQSPCLSGG